MTITIDAMGGDHGPSVVVPAALRALQNHPSLHLILVGDETILQETLKSERAQQNDRLKIHHASQQVSMDEAPASALRGKKDSSMRVAINLVKEGQAQACVSAGNTGALMATARFVLKTLPGIDRPAILSVFPTREKNKCVRMLDLGANVDSTPEHLFQFAVMGSVLTSAVDNIPHPRISLLNIGEEDIKGNDLVKATAQLLSQSTLNYIGYIEGNDIYQNKTDLIVCDGFVGNVALKTAEGVSRLISILLKEGFRKNVLTRIAALFALPVLKSVAKRINPERYNGASLIGLQGIVIKSHGGANVVAFEHAIEEAMIEVEKNVPKQIGVQVENLLKQYSDKKGGLE